MIREIEWTDHARDRLQQWHVSKTDIEAVIRVEHPFRSSNSGRADWQVIYFHQDGKRFKVLYNHPVDGDETRARAVTIIRQGLFHRRQ
jgi:hypothetical protein